MVSMMVSLYVFMLYNSCDQVTLIVMSSILIFIFKTDLLLCRKFVATDIKVLRVAMSSFFDMLVVAIKTLQEFDEP